MEEALVRRRSHLPSPYRSTGSAITHLSEAQLNCLTESFQKWFDEAKNRHIKRIRGRYFLTFLVLRFTGARLQEVLLLDDAQDVDYRLGEIRLKTLKRKKEKVPVRTVPVPQIVTIETARYLAQYPDMRSKVFQLQQSNFRNVFYKMCALAGIPRALAHPHICRHSRALELVRGLIPLTVVRDLLGHKSLETTAVYLQFSGIESKMILKDRGFI
jgi:molybdate transport system regulatory protein